MILQEPLIFIGDTHGDMMRVSSIISSPENSGSTFIHVGDFGIGASPEGPKGDLRLLMSLNDLCAENKTSLCIVRGNHDDPQLFTGGQFMGYNKHLENVHLMSDYSAVTTSSGLSVGFVGGAVSIDRKYRISRRLPHWVDSICFEESEETILGMLPKGSERLDILVTHSAPNDCYPNSNNDYIVRQFSENLSDPTLVDDCKDEREYLQRVANLLNPRYIYYGHFHVSRSGKINLPLGSCTYRCMNQGGETHKHISQ